MKPRIKTRYYTGVLIGVLLILSISCKKHDHESEHYTVCVTCIRLSNHDTIPDRCMRDDFVSHYIADMGNAHDWLGRPSPYNCWRH